MRGTPELTTVEVRSHFVAAGLNAQTPGATVPSALPDPRSLFVQVHYSFMPLPAEPMATRRADDARLGHFTTTVQDYSDDLARKPQAALRQPLALGQEGPGGGAVRARHAHHLLAGPQHSRGLPGHYHQRPPCWPGTKAFERIGFKQRDRGEAAHRNG